jgi:hypothetical protein
MSCAPGEGIRQIRRQASERKLRGDHLVAAAGLGHRKRDVGTLEE